MEWNDETIARLRQLWDEGLSTAEIGRRLGVSKNAVVGKAHRLLLPPRPSPIRRDRVAVPRPAAARRVTGPTLPPLPASEPAPPRQPAEPALTLAPPVSEPAPQAMRAPPPIRAVPPSPGPSAGRHTACCWPLGDPGTKSFRFCDGGSLPGKPYCAEHAQLAYVKVRDRREEAAA